MTGFGRPWAGKVVSDMSTVAGGEPRDAAKAAEGRRLVDARSPADVTLQQGKL